jgi:aminoglycoside phosphotransferase (APT) family kinase protein
MREGSDINDRLLAFLAAQLGDVDVRVAGLARIGVGRSRENWVFDLLTSHDGVETREPLILRTDPDGGLVETSRQREFALLDALEKSDLPAPVPRWLDADGRWFGRPSLIMRRAHGVCDYKILGDETRPVPERRALAEQFCDLLGQVHRTDWRALGLHDRLPDPGEDAARVELSHWEQILRQDALEPYPELELAVVVLRETAPSAARTVLVHADFKPGNILLDGDRVSALLDWELAHLGDPLEDLGWVTQPLRTGEHLVPGGWDCADLLAHYQRITGHKIDQRSLSWWRTFSTFKTAVMQISGLRSFLEGRSDEPYRPTRRVLDTLIRAISKEDGNAADH